MCIRDSLRTVQKLAITCAKPISRPSAVGAISQGGQPVEDVSSTDVNLAQGEYHSSSVHQHLLRHRGRSGTSRCLP
eukprot:681881-Prorocentrum_lima.AAC.1